MKRILLFTICFIISTPLLACSYTDEYNLAKLSSYVDYIYFFNDNQKFDVTIINLPNELMIKYNNEFINPTSNKIVINNLNMGLVLEVGIYSSSKSSCLDKYLRSLYIKLPYKNKFYNTNKCRNYAYTEVCKNEFLSYEVTDKIFNTYINSYKINSGNYQINNNNQVYYPKENYDKYIITSFCIVGFDMFLMIMIIILKKKKIGF